MLGRSRQSNPNLRLSKEGPSQKATSSKKYLLSSSMFCSQTESVLNNVLYSHLEKFVECGAVPKELSLKIKNSMALIAFIFAQSL